MMNRFLAFILFFLTTGYLLAQDMPPLPPLPSQPSSPAASNDATANPALPPLPDQKAAPAGNTSPALPPLPDQPAAPATTTASPANPPLPGDQGQAAPATQEAAPAGTPAHEAAPAPKPAKEVKPWERTKHRPNVIFGGWINPKGGNESSRLSWASQEVLNALVFKKYKVLKEEGKYDGEAGAGGHQFRDITFSIPKSKLKVEVYLKCAGKKVWMRVGPSEPPAFSINSIAQVQKTRDADLKALHFIQKKMGRRLSPHRIVKSWEAPYRFAKETADE